MDSRPRQIIHQNLHYTILQLSFPGMVSSVLQTLFQLIDAYWVGKLGAAALAAIGGCSFILWAIFSLTALSVNGISALVAQNIGAGKYDRARLTAGQGIMISTAVSLFLLVATLLFQNALYTLMGFSSEVSQPAHDYMTIVLFGLPFVFWFTSLESVFRGMGNTRTPMYILAIALALNAVLDPLLILGWLGLPALGIKGAALATALAQLLASALCWFLLKRYEFLPLIHKKGRALLDRLILLRILSIGAPIAFGGFFFSLIYVLLTNIISRFGTEAIAAISVGHRIEGVAWFACVGFSVAVSTPVFIFATP